MQLRQVVENGEALALYIQTLRAPDSRSGSPMKLSRPLSRGYTMTRKSWRLTDLGL